MSAGGLKKREEVIQINNKAKQVKPALKLYKCILLYDISIHL